MTDNLREKKGEIDLYLMWKWEDGYPMHSGFYIDEIGKRIQRNRPILRLCSLCYCKWEWQLLLFSVTTCVT